MGFKDELFAFEKTLSNGDIGCEDDIVEEDIAKALIVLNFMECKKVPDVFLACASMNLLNAYAKKHDSKIGYQYKRHITEIVKGIEDVQQPKSILIGYDKSNNMQLLIVQFWSFQFSFQAQRFSLPIKRMLSTKNIVWDGVRKQPHAKRIFDFAYSRSWISNQTMLGKDIRKCIDS